MALNWNDDLLNQTDTHTVLSISLKYANYTRTMRKQKAVFCSVSLYLQICTKRVGVSGGEWSLMQNGAEATHAARSALSHTGSYGTVPRAAQEERARAARRPSKKWTGWNHGLNWRKYLYLGEPRVCLMAWRGWCSVNALAHTYIHNVHTRAAASWLLALICVCVLLLWRTRGGVAMREERRMVLCSRRTPLSMLMHTKQTFWSHAATPANWTLPPWLTSEKQTWKSPKMPLKISGVFRRVWSG